MNDFIKALLLHALKAALTAFASVIVNANLDLYYPGNHCRGNADDPAAGS